MRWSHIRLVWYVLRIRASTKFDTVSVRVVDASRSRTFPRVFECTMGAFEYNCQGLEAAPEEDVNIDISGSFPRVLSFRILKLHF